MGGENYRKIWVNLSRRVHRDVCVYIFLSVRACVRADCLCVRLKRNACSGDSARGGALRMDSSEARSCAVLCTIRIKVAISGHYLLRDVLSSVLMAPPTKSIKKRQRRPAH